MITQTNINRTKPYRNAIDRRLFSLKNDQGSLSDMSQSIWECISVLVMALNKKINGFEYSIYFELIERKTQEYGLGNYFVENIPIHKHLESLKFLIQKKSDI